MFESNLVDLDELVLMVRDRNSRAYIGEAITTYRVRAYRSALLATWVAVAYDIISKIRELDVQGDATAGTFVTALDNAIDANDRGDPEGLKRLQTIENELLNKAAEDFEFLSAQQRKDLDRLKSDRNLCASPRVQGAWHALRAQCRVSAGSHCPHRPPPAASSAGARQTCSQAIEE